MAVHKTIEEILGMIPTGATQSTWKCPARTLLDYEEMLLERYEEDWGGDPPFQDSWAEAIHSLWNEANSLIHSGVCWDTLRRTLHNLAEIWGWL